jgi:predicted PurR-regulated permease PerM
VVPNQYFELFISAIHKIEHLLSNYLIGLLLQMMAIFSIAGLGLSIFGVKYALTIAIFAALANLIPYLGPMLGAVFGIIIGLTSHGHFGFDQLSVVLVLKIVSVFAVVQAADNILLQPLIFSKSVKAHPLEIFVVIFAAASLAGIPGMIAAIPVYTIIRVSVVEIQSGFKSYKIFKLSK